ncbi:glycosyltransferase family 20 protein [Heterobasidion irregulare TC 32-1]|uniref:Glycosyltransferase family 20 protein n=1 Tax=Heterobasidion irregulare (strain TC 32-1) TaxID=747525 RepID=W4JXL6_HETIT|nr:glycosyltransferase family 20 protein [Heterobasidion irregulare TC 32-1]ETW77810.1 glycosyltransferase family 20 protein [Heterobasidion irregulare TC 32-1]
MDSFSEPRRLPEVIHLGDVRTAVASLEAEHRAKGIPLSGRVLHVCHYLPITATLHSSSRPGILSPPATPPSQPSDIPPSPTDASAPTTNGTAGQDDSVLHPKWSLATRQGHAAMISGIRSLSSTHEQLIIGWTGDIESPVTSSGGEKLKISANSLSEEDRTVLEEEISNFKAEEEHGKTTYVPVWLDDKVAHGHYDGYCKQTLWPLFHYLLWQDVSPTSNSASFSADTHWPPYEQANAAFTRRILDVYQPGDLVWVHDYHLLLVPKQLRVTVPDACVGLFVHTPWPSSEVFRCLPRRKEILDGMLGANLVCFQTYSYSRHFTSSCVRVCGYEVAARGIDVQGHVTSVMHCPVGVDADRVAQDLLRPGIQPKLQALLKLYAGKKIIIGRDKLDVVKGVVQKLRAFAKLLQDYPEWIGNVVLIQVTSPALTDSPKLERQISELVSSINGEYGGLDFIPVHHYHQTIKKDEFYALLSAADLAVITPLRDGMNTTSMEFVIAQGKTKKSPLVLSEFMGISSNMTDALQINPWNLGDVASAMNRGLLMSTAEKEQRHAKLHEVVTTQTSHTWAAMLVKMLLGVMGTSNMARQTPVLPTDNMFESYAKAKKRLFLCDYDGTLAPIVKTPSMAIPTEDTLTALTQLAADPRNLVYIISGRDGAFLEQHLGHIESLGMSAEHGGFIREPGSRDWVNFTESLDMDWMGEVLEVFKYYTERTTGSHIEVKKSSITWHYRSSDPEWGQFQCRQCQDLLENNVAHKRPIEVLVGKKNLEVRPIAVNKGEIVKRILYENPDAEFVFCAGDDKTDEDMFRALSFSEPDGPLTMDPPISVSLVTKDATEELMTKSLALTPHGVFTTAVGHPSKRTLAKWHVTSPAEVVNELLRLAGANKASGTADEAKL